ncbi:sulfoxide reductase heme-binding subunit YedZ [Tepidimonas taiwanensis]|uniref:Protein-methionine-sulfoxide reductase heme-binding subunit MsrQ n=1 Tax=Tepidimonas taiwanensis TaxID=307486 RepID=A0A554XE29_9BURK|nr:protein-methionine-sulfoxide reductase heme-binding subunit MsrQ [Tepidimonas taiwanensis]TSE34092.1 Protein-methionine-sulfoxide reductase heme-binding subunit MsrQ [Tepidimonas taiwanensis]UBQ04934.1 sulfoxide reductase heme-binding subunit YedZ [Tepidimonas taiwanensis]
MPAAVSVNRALRAAKPWALALCAVPALWLWAMALADRLGAHPAEALIRGLGDWALRFLWLTLAVTPLRCWTGWGALAGWRRGLGLWAFAYATVHLTAYAWLDQGWDVRAVLHDVAQRPFILVGMLAILGLLPLAATSFDAAIRWLGALRWRRLHRLVYAVAVLAVLHFFWMRSGKRLYGEVAVYAGILAVLLGWRVWDAISRARARAPDATGR